MKRKYIAIIFGVVALTLNLMIPACGSKNSATSPYASTLCVTGQVCTGITGTPLFPAPIISSIDAFGSATQMQIYASNYTSGGGSANVTVQAIVYIAQNSYGCPPGQYSVQGTGTWSSNYGGTLGLINAQMTGTSGFTVQLSGEVFQGQDPSASQATSFYYVGRFANSCDASATAL
jgi:hypothetical protein